MTAIQSAQVTAIFSHTYLRSEDRPYDPVHYIGIIYNLTLGHFELRDERNGTTDHCRWFTESQVRQLPLVPLGEFAIELVWPHSSLSAQAIHRPAEETSQSVLERGILAQEKDSHDH
jgi:hypothetical protein